MIYYFGCYNDLQGNMTDYMEQMLYDVQQLYAFRKILFFSLIKLCL